MTLRLLFLLSLITNQKLAICQEAKLLPDSSILLDISKGKELLRDCSGSALLPLVESIWIPNNKEYQDLRLSFDKLTNQVKNIDDFIIQYIGIMFEGKKFIYINAFHKHYLSEAKRVYNNLSTSAVVCCGGGNLYWRVLFDINAREFGVVKFNAPN